MPMKSVMPNKFYHLNSKTTLNSSNTTTENVRSWNITESETLDIEKGQNESNICRFLVPNFLKDLTMIQRIYIKLTNGNHIA